MTDIYEKTKEPDVYIVTPIFFQDEKKALLALNLNLQEMLYSLSEFKDEFETLEMHIVDKRGKHLVRKKEEGIGAAVKELHSEFNDISRRAWIRMLVEENDSFFQDGDLLSNTTVLDPGDIWNKNIGNIDLTEKKSFYWKIMFRTSKDNFNKIKIEILKGLIHPFASFSLMALFLSFFIGYTSSRRKLVEESLKVAGEVYQNSQDGILIVDSKFKILYVNSSLLQMLGYSSEEILERNMAILRSDDHDEKHYRDVEKSLHSNGSWKGEIWIRMKNWESKPAFLSISKVSPNKYVGVYTDLSLPKIREKEINIMKNYDTLTMLPNKKHFEEIVDYEIKNNSDYFITVVSFYIKNTSLIIDRFGMVVLENLFNLMRDKISEKLEYRDTLSRFSGSYFGLLLTCIKEQEEIERKIQEINSMTKEPLLIDGKEIYVECSFGIATYPNDGTSAGTLIKNSMLAQHQATLVYGKDYFFLFKGY